MLKRARGKTKMIFKKTKNQNKIYKCAKNTINKQMCQFFFQCMCLR